jgi:hypothetical protein
VYEVHKVVDETTHEHKPMLISVNAGKTYEAMTLTDEQVENLYVVGIREGARPLVRHDDGRIQVGHYVFVPKTQEEQ